MGTMVVSAGYGLGLFGLRISWSRRKSVRHLRGKCARRRRGFILSGDSKGSRWERLITRRK